LLSVDDGLLLCSNSRDVGLPTSRSLLSSTVRSSLKEEKRESGRKGAESQLFVEGDATGRGKRKELEEKAMDSQRICRKGSEHRRQS